MVLLHALVNPVSATVAAMTPRTPTHRTRPAPRPWWTLQRSDDPVIATAIHDGGDLRPEVAAAMALPPAERLREEDPFTGQAIRDVPTHVIPHRSRFEVDLNRAEEDAVYLTPEQCWGLQVWQQQPAESVVAGSRRMHRAFYRMFGQLTDDVARSHGRFVVLDVHSYNHRRDGPQGPPMPQPDAPDINIGTFSMPRGHWAFLVDPLIEAMRGFDFCGRQLDVRENIAFQGRGALTRFVHERHPEAGCAIAIEFKKFYMDEWSGQPDPRALDAMRALVSHVADVSRALLDE